MREQSLDGEAYHVTPDRALLRHFVDAALTKITRPDQTTVIAVPAPRGPLEQLLNALPMPFGTIWWPPTEWGFSAIGAARELRLSGENRLAQLESSSEALFDGMVLCRYPGCHAPPPRIHGGLAFSAGSHDDLWSEFGDGCFVLPRWSYGRSDEQTVLSLACAGQPDGAARQQFSNELDRILDSLERAPSISMVSSTMARNPIEPIRPESLLQLDPADWNDRIEAIRDAIRSGKFEKIVAARRCEIRSPVLDDIQIFARLGHEYPGCNRFLFRRTSASFLGASPERLFAKRGDAVATQALAGSISLDELADPNDEAAAQRHLRSDKNLAEHRVVVREISEALTPLTRELTVDDEPSALRVRNILHLNTPIRGRLRASTRAHQILASMHPTPAVGGVPRWDAVQWILDHETASRGWYTGPVGWLDAAGDAEFVVALRCGLVGPTRSFVYSGAGVMIGSDPASEYAETALKQQPVLRALGVAI